MYLLIIAIFFAFALSIGFLWRYGNIPRQHPLVSVSVVVAWSFSFLIVFAIPLDLTGVSLIIFALNDNKKIKKKKYCELETKMMMTHNSIFVH